MTRRSDMYKHVTVYERSLNQGFWGEFKFRCDQIRNFELALNSSVVLPSITWQTFKEPLGDLMKGFVSRFPSTERVKVM
jgi:hypothetical protein